MNSKSPIARTVYAFICLALSATLFRELMLVLEGRPGTPFPDPLLIIWGPFPLHLPIFLVTYLPIAIGSLILMRDTERRIGIIYAYCLLQLFRISCIYAFPLEAPQGMILLKDPIADHLVFGSTVTKDLFFSGHVSTLILFSLYLKGRGQRWGFRFLAFLDAGLLTAQHVHYSIDVLAAPIFALAAARMQQALSKRFVRRA